LFDVRALFDVSTATQFCPTPAAGSCWLTTTQLSIIARTGSYRGFSISPDANIDE